MPGCVVPMCSHHNYRDTCNFRRFPANETLRKIWLQNIKRKDPINVKNARICTCHFTAENTVIPTIFMWSEKNMKNEYLFASLEPRRGLRKARLKQRENKLIQAASIAVRVEEPIFIKHEPLLDEDYNIKCHKFTQTDIVFGCSTHTQTINSVQDEAEMTLLKSEVETLKVEIARLKQPRFGWHNIEHDEKLIMHYTGIGKNAISTIIRLCNEIQFEYVHKCKLKSLNFHDQLLITLMKLRSDSPYIDLSVRFCVPVNIVSNVFRTILLLLHRALYKVLMSEVPSREKNLPSLPSCHQFTNCQMRIYRTQFSTESRSRFDHQKSKQRNTVKVIFGIAPNGIITYCSDAYPGSISDKELLKQCGVLEIINDEDSTMTDTSFGLKDLELQGVTINIPSFLSIDQFAAAQVQETCATASERIPIEQGIKRIKMYKILNPIPKLWHPYSSKIIQVCTALTNFRNPLVKVDDENEDDIHAI